jgi:hypothetical protein
MPNRTNKMPRSYYTRLERLIRESGATKTEFSEHIGMTPSALTQCIKRGTGMDKGGDLLKAARFLNVTIDYLVSGKPGTGVELEEQARTWPTVHTDGADVILGSELTNPPPATWVVVTTANDSHYHLGKYMDAGESVVLAKRDGAAEVIRREDVKKVHKAIFVGQSLLAASA